MQVYKTFFRIVKTCLISILITLSIYMVMAAMMGRMGEEDGASGFQTAALDIYVADEDQTPASKALTHYLGSIHNVHSQPESEQSLQDQLYYRTIKYILRIPAGFGQRLASADPNTEHLLSNIKIPGNISGQFLDSQIRMYVQTLRLYISGGSSMQEAIGRTDASLASVPDVQVISFQKGDRGNNSELFLFFRYLPYGFILLLVNTMTKVLVTLNASGVYQRTLCSPLKLLRRNLQMALGGVTLSLALWLIFMAMTFCLYGDGLLTEDGLLCMANSLVFLLVCAALALFVSNFALSQNAITMCSNVLGLGMCFLCGVFVPMSFLPQYVVNIGKFSPAYWYTVNNDLAAGFANAPFDANTFLAGLGIQLLFALALFCASLAAAKLRRQSGGS